MQFFLILINVSNIISLFRRKMANRSAQRNMTNERVNYVSNINYSARSLNKILATKKLEGNKDLLINSYNKNHKQRPVPLIKG